VPTKPAAKPPPEEAMSATAETPVLETPVLETPRAMTGDEVSGDAPQSPPKRSTWKGKAVRKALRELYLNEVPPGTKLSHQELCRAVPPPTELSNPLLCRAVLDRLGSKDGKTISNKTILRVAGRA
jgi:hypothetical protein